MRKENLWNVRWSSIILGLLLVAGAVLAASGQPCGGAGCWELREPIYIFGNAGFDCDNGVVSGSGTQFDPYIIEGWHIVAAGLSHAINIENTSKHVIIRNCVIETASSAGIRFYGVSNASIERCHLLRNERAILLENSRDNGIVDNLIANNLYGIDLVLGTRDTAISSNTFVSNGRNGYDPAGRNIWYCAAGGNYWSDYDGPDKDCDGIGDIPYNSPVDRYPLMTSPWQCALPVNDICGLHCEDSTQVLKVIGPPAAPCETPCAPTTSCPSTPACATPCAPTMTMCTDQIITCTNPTATLTADFRPSRASCQPCTIQWVKEDGQTVGTGPAINVSAPGVYTARVAGADGCGISRSVTVLSDVNAPVVQASVTGELSCSTDEVLVEAVISGGVAPYTIEWTQSGMGSLGCESWLMACQPGAYTVTVTGANGCASSDTVVVKQDLQAPRVNAVVGGELSCEVRQVKLTALASNGQLPYTYQWRGPSGQAVGSAPDVYVSQPGTYSVTVAGANGCSAVGTAIVSEDAGAPSVGIRVDGMLTCSISEVQLTANVSHGRPPYQIEWVGPSGNLVGTAPLLLATMPGLYTVTVSGANGCSTSESTTVQQDRVLPTVDAGPDQLISDEITQIVLTATIDAPAGPYTVAWENGLGEIISTTPTVTVDRPGEYTVTVTRDTGCSASDTVAVQSEIITEVMLDSGIEGLAVFGQLTLDGVPIPESAFYFLVDTIESADGVEVSSVALRTGTGEGFRANGAEVNYIIPGNSIVTFQIHRDQFVAGKWYNLPHLPIDPPGAAAVKFF